MIVAFELHARRRQAHAVRSRAARGPARLSCRARTRRGAAPARRHRLLDAAVLHRRRSAVAARDGHASGHRRGDGMRVNRLLRRPAAADGRSRRLPEAAASTWCACFAARWAMPACCSTAMVPTTPRASSPSASAMRVSRSLGVARDSANESPLPHNAPAIAGARREDGPVLQKATELGVAGFVPVASERSEVRLDGERVGQARRPLAQRRDRGMRAVRARARAAGGDPGRAAAGSARVWNQPRPRLLLDPVATLVAGDLDIDAGAPTLSLAIGPEGGWSPRDRAALVGAGFQGMRLGPRILRTETAGIAAIAALQALHGDFALSEPLIALRRRPRALRRSGVRRARGPAQRGILVEHHAGTHAGRQLTVPALPQRARCATPSPGAGSPGSAGRRMASWHCRPVP